MNIKDLKDLPNGTIFYLKYRRNNNIKTYEYVKVENNKIRLLNNVSEYGVSDFYILEFEFTIDNDSIFVENPYFSIVRVVKIEKPIQYDLIYIYGENNE